MFVLPVLGSVWFGLTTHSAGRSSSATVRNYWAALFGDPAVPVPAMSGVPARKYWPALLGGSSGTGEERVPSFHGPLLSVIRQEGPRFTFFCLSVCLSLAHYLGGIMCL